METSGNIAAIRYNLGARIRMLRKGQELSQYTFSQMISLDRTYIIGVEKGRRNISIDNLSKISQGLGISLSELCESVDTAEAIAARISLMNELLESNKKQASQDDEGSAEHAD